MNLKIAICVKKISSTKNVVTDKMKNNRGICKKWYCCWYSTFYKLFLGNNESLFDCNNEVKMILQDLEAIEKRLRREKTI
jgi:hypothetical protein